PLAIASHTNGFQLTKMPHTKYRKLKLFLSDQLRENKSEKFVIFAYFRRTLEYLQRRLDEDGIETALILGGMGNLSFERIEAFGRKDGPSVLLSSEVGSEGIDLQFCRFIVNYDLPWNPMRVEQRIGRLDRLGQKAERISIINFVVEETIEDRILMRLYDRIELFRESIGDLEHILGIQTYQLLEKLLDPKLDEETRLSIAKQAEDAIIIQRKNQQKIEDEAVNLLGFSDYIYEQIQSSRNLGRWLSTDELLSLVSDFFARKYPGTIVELDRNKNSVARILLSRDARVQLHCFISDYKPATRTILHKSSIAIPCNFDPRQTKRNSPMEELIEPTHPLIQWIRREYESQNQSLHQVSSVSVDSGSSRFHPGDYVYAIQKWSFDGLRKEHQLSFKAMRIDSNEFLDEQLSEEIVTLASRYGKTLHNAAKLVGNLDILKSKVEACDAELDEFFGKKCQAVETQNKTRCDQQETSATNYKNRRVMELRERISRYRNQGKINMIPATEGLLKREEDQFALKLKKISEKRKLDSSLEQMAVGFIRVI
ncbi:MAG: helicase-related protein, partial [Acidiferrobacterales bacterium]|nr:helicase-related protein [Acidiferrobacterales bacterium]